MQSCDEKINSLINTFCDISKFADNKHAYARFSPLRNAFMGSIVRNYKIGCLEGVSEYLVPYYQAAAKKYYEYTEYPLRSVFERNEACLHSKDNYTVQLLSIWFYPFVDYDQYSALEQKLRNKAISAEKFEQTYKRIDGHELVVLIDRRNKELRLIDPNGSDVTYATTLNELVFQHFKGPRYEDYKIRPFREACPNIGPQYLTQDEHCLLWALLIGYLNLACPESSVDVVDLLVSLGKEKLTRLLDGWFCYAASYVEITGIVEVYNFLMKGEWGKLSFQELIERNFQTGNIPTAQKMIEVVKTYNRSRKRGAVDLLESLDEYDALDLETRREIDASYQRYVAS